MGKFTIRRGLALGAALVAGGALALPFVSQASPSTPATSTPASTSTTTSTGATTTTPTATTPTTTPSTTTTTPKPRPPLAYSGYVQKITASSALLKARVNPEGSATEYYFQYGPTAAYGSQTPSAAAGSSTSEIKVTQTITGLEPYTTYHFRLLASNSTGTTPSADATFTTKQVPLSLTAAAAPNPVAFGSPLVLSGNLSGTGNAGVGVVLQANAFPFNHGFHDITSPEPTNTAGSFSFPIAGLLQSTQLRTATVGKPTIVSAVITELVTVHITLHVRPARRRGFVRLYGTVTPAEPGDRVAFERFDHGQYVPVSGTVLGTRPGAGSRFGRAIRLRRRGRYRALVQVASGTVISGRSRPVLIQ